MQNKRSEEVDVLMKVKNNVTVWNKLQNSLRLVRDESSLLEIANEILTMSKGENAPLKFIELLREKIFLIFIQKLKFDINLFKLYPLFSQKRFKLAPHKDMVYIKNKLLNGYYEKADNINKEAILILTLLVGILNQRKEESLKDFITKYSDIDITVKEFSEIIDILNITPNDVVNIYIKSGVLSPDAFMNKPIVIQKRNLLFLYRIWAKFKCPSAYVKFYEPLRCLFYEAIESGNIELVLYVSFFIRFYYGNLNVSYDAWKRLDDEIERPMSDFFIAYCKENNILPCNRKPEGDKKIRVGYAYQQLAMSSPVSVLLSLLSGHYLNKNTDIEFYIYGYDYKEKIGDTEDITNIIKSMDFKCVSAGQLGDFKDIYCSHFEKAMALRKQIIENGIDIFVTTATQIGNFLVSSRVAPVQIYWSHVDPFWNVNNLDYRIVHSAEESVVKGLYGGMEYFKFPNVMAMEFLAPLVSSERVKQLREKFPSGKVILGYIGRLAKINNQEYLGAVSDMLNSNPEAVFVICGEGDARPIKRYFESAGLIDRIYFEGHVNPHVYGHVIDIALDSFPVPMGVASLEFFAKGKPMVSMETNHEEVNKFRLKEVHGRSAEEYTQIADTLIKDKDYRYYIGGKYQNFAVKKLDCQKAARELEMLYKNLFEGKCI